MLKIQWFPAFAFTQRLKFRIRDIILFIPILWKLVSQTAACIWMINVNGCNLISYFHTVTWHMNKLAKTLCWGHTILLYKHMYTCPCVYSVKIKVLIISQLYNIYKLQSASWPPLQCIDFYFIFSHLNLFSNKFACWLLLAGHGVCVISVL